MKRGRIRVADFRFQRYRERVTMMTINLFILGYERHLKLKNTFLRIIMLTVGIFLFKIVAFPLFYFAKDMRNSFNLARGLRRIDPLLSRFLWATSFYISEYSSRKLTCYNPLIFSHLAGSDLDSMLLWNKKLYHNYLSPLRLLSYIYIFRHLERNIFEFKSLWTL